jgi:hypothetical protein
MYPTDQKFGGRVEEGRVVLHAKTPKPLKDIE